MEKNKTIRHITWDTADGTRWWMLLSSDDKVIFFANSQMSGVYKIITPATNGKNYEKKH